MKIKQVQVLTEQVQELLVQQMRQVLVMQMSQARVQVLPILQGQAQMFLIHPVQGLVM